MTVSIDRETSRARIELVLDQEIPPVAEFEEQADEVRALFPDPQRAAVEILGSRRTSLAAWVRLPWGFDEHPEARYPLVIAHGHFLRGPDGFRETPPDPDLKPDYSKRFQLAGYNRIQQEYAWQAHQDWITPGFPRVLLVEIQHPTPYLRRFIRRELGEQRSLWRRDPVRADPRDREGVPRPRHRLVALRLRRLDRRLGSDGGADVLPGRLQRRLDRLPGSDRFPALRDGEHLQGPQRLHDGESVTSARPGRGTATGLGTSTRRSKRENRYESMLGTRGRSGDQWDAWESVFSPLGAGWISAPHLGPRDGRNGPGHCRILARALRPRAYPAVATGRRSGQSSAGNCASTPATWTITISTTPCMASRRS